MKMMFVEDCCEILDSMRVPITAADRECGKYPYYGANGIQDYVADYIFDDELVLLAEDGGNFGSKEKPIAYRVSGKCWVNNHAHVLKTKDGVDVDYLCYSLMFYKVGGMVNGATRQKLTQAAMRKMQIPSRSMKEQLHIVNELNKIIKIKEQRQQELILLDNLIKARFVEMFGDPVDNPMGWEIKQLQELVTDDCPISYGIVQTGDDQEDGIPVFRPVDIVNHIPMRSELKKTTEEISNKYKRTILKGREMLITVRANIADTYIVGEEFSGCNVGRGIVPIRTRENEIILEFLKYQIDSKHLNDNIKALAKGITLIQLNMEDLREITLIVPPIEKQKSFVEFAKQTDKSKAAVQKALDQTQLLFDSLMQEYFG
jgi:type I restriction enzyme S subunit